MDKKLYRVMAGKKVSGVCMGLAQYLNVDVTIIRLIWVIATLFTSVFPGVILYILCVIIIPVEPGYIEGEYQEKQ
ncbi:MAG TPA: PspC domain-containing protein [Firmicutes bacterium]|nr:PspC domain-containing protein [Bacillota bacterium]